MLGDIPVFDITLVAGEDLTGQQYKAVKLNAAGAAIKAAAGDGLFILQNTPKAGTAASVRFHGISFGITAGAITAGDRVTSDASGLLVKATKAQVATTNITGTSSLGIAMRSAGAGETITVLMRSNEIVNV